jgi:hypothetical protein
MKALGNIYPGQAVKTKGANVRLRASGSLASEILATVPVSGTAVGYLTGRQETDGAYLWYQLEYTPLGSDRVAWIRNDVAAIDATHAVSPESAAQADLDLILRQDVETMNTLNESAALLDNLKTKGVDITAYATRLNAIVARLKDRQDGLQQSTWAKVKDRISDGWTYVKSWFGLSGLYGVYGFDGRGVGALDASFFKKLAKVLNPVNAIRYLNPVNAVKDAKALVTKDPAPQPETEAEITEETPEETLRRGGSRRTGFNSKIAEGLRRVSRRAGNSRYPYNSRYPNSQYPNVQYPYNTQYPNAQYPYNAQYPNAQYPYYYPAANPATNATATPATNILDTSDAATIAKEYNAKYGISGLGIIPIVIVAVAAIAVGAGGAAMITLQPWKNQSNIDLKESKELRALLDSADPDTAAKIRENLKNQVVDAYSLGNRQGVFSGFWSIGKYVLIAGAALYFVPKLLNSFNTAPAPAQRRYSGNAFGTGAKKLTSKKLQ